MQYYKRISRQVRVFFCMVFFGIVMLPLKTQAAVPSQITDYKPQVVESTAKGTVINSAGETVNVTISHPGVGMTKSELDNMRDHVRAGDEPWASAFAQYATQAKSSLNPRILYENNEDFIIVPNVWTNNTRKEYVTLRGNKDSSTAVNQAIMWYITGNDTYRGNCMHIIRLWSQITHITPEKDFRWGITSYQLAFAAEIMRYSDCETEEYKWTEEDTANFTRFLDLCKGCNEYTKTYWMNQHDFVTMGILACGVFENDFERYAMAVEMTTVNRQGMQGGNNGSIYWQCRLMTKNEETGEEIPKEEQTVQLIESGRDQGHAYATISGLSTLAQSIYVQGTLVDPETGEISNEANAVNPFEFQDDRLLKGITTALRYNLGYEDNWITADSSRGYYREPSTASWRGRVNYCLGIVYNYYRYIEGEDMTKEEFADLAKTYERYMPELTTSDDFPLAATLLYLPDNAKDNFTNADWYAESDMVKQLENYTAKLSGTAETKTEGDITYVRMTPGTEIATSTYAWPAEGGMGLRVRSNGTATVEVKRMHNTYAPKAVFEIPDTKGKWVTVTCNTANTPYNDGNIIFYKVNGEASYVDLDSVDFASEEAEELEIAAVTSCLTEMKGGETIYLLPAGKNSEFRIQSQEGSTYYYVDTQLQNYSVNPTNGILTITPGEAECGKVYEVWAALQRNGFASVKKILVKPYAALDDVIEGYVQKYYPQSAEYTEESKAAFATAVEKYKNTALEEKQDAAKAVLEAFNGLEGLLVYYDFEDENSGVLKDISGNGNDGRLYKNAKKVSDDTLNSKVLTLDGSIGTYAALPKGILNDTDAFTVSFDVKPTTVSGNFFTYAIGTDSYGYTYLKTLENALDTRITKYSAEGEQQISASVDALAERWVNVTVVYEKEKIAIYLDKKLVGAKKVTCALSDIGQNLEFWLGRSFWLWDAWFAGSYDNFKVYNYAMTKAQIGDMEEDDVTITYIVGDGAKIIGEDVQTVKKGESASKIALYPYLGYTFAGWSDGSMSLTREDSYLLEDTTLYARFRKAANASSMEASYDMEERSGASVRDVTGNGNYLMLYGNASILTDESTQSNVLYLDGSTGTYAEFPKGLFDGMESVTICMDVKHMAQKAANYMTFAVGKDNTKYYFLRTNDTSIKSAITVNSYGAEETIQTDVDSIQDIWTTLTVVLNENSMTIYQDGKKIDENTEITLGIPDIGSELSAYLGKSMYDGDGYFAGYLDNIKVYNYALSEEVITGAKKEEIELSYKAGVGGSIVGTEKQVLEAGADGSTVTAVAEEGYRFVEWSDGNANVERTDTNVQRSYTYEAVFERIGITVSDNLVADYEMAYGRHGVLENKASGIGRLDAKLVGITESDFIKDGSEAVLNFSGTAGKYVELQKGLVGEYEEFSIETTVKSTVNAYHWLYSIGNIVDAKNYIFLNPCTPSGAMLAAIKDDVTETRILEDILPATADRAGYNTITLTFDKGKICVYVNGALAAVKDTDYTLTEILENGTTGDYIGYIGKSLYASDPAFSGTLKSFKVFDCALDAERIKARYEGAEEEKIADISEEKVMEYYLNFEDEEVTDHSINHLQSTIKAELKKTVSYVAGCDGKGKAVVLNKSEETQNYIQVEDTKELVPQKGTISFWLKAPKGGMIKEQGILSFATGEYTQSIAISAAAEENGNKKALCINLKKDGAVTTFFTNMQAGECFPEDTWVHMIVSYDGTTAKVYRNGSEIPVYLSTQKWEKQESGCTIGKSKNASGKDIYLCAALDECKVFNYVLGETEVQKLAAVKKKERIAYFSFDDETSGLTGSGARAEVVGKLNFSNEAKKGMALSFDGTGSAWLNVAAEEGGSLLTGLEEMTVSYYGKAQRTDGNWTFYAAPDANAQGENPTYLGILDRNNEIVAERHNHGRKATAVVDSSDAWKHIAVVFSKMSIKIYVDGMLAKTASNSEELTQILGENSILQIGKANWGEGEYYQGYIDEYSIYNYAMSQTDILNLLAKNTEKTTHLVAYMAQAGGKVTGLTVQEVENGADGTEVKAVAAEGYTFVEWNDGVKTAERKESAVTADVVYTAIFAKTDDSQGDTNGDDFEGDNPDEDNSDESNPNEDNLKEDTSGGEISEGNITGGNTSEGNSSGESVSNGTDTAPLKQSDSSSKLARPTIKVKAAKAGKVNVSWKKIKGAKGYVVYTSTKKIKGFKAVKTLKKASKTKVSFKAKKKVKKLYVKVRAYYKKSGKKVYGPYSKTKAVKIKR
ncbi:MAG: InlB B-repeat-containing protein [Lachnospiraceae bacterium]|nr:InlB B-repeat-containing protein [Lachnospiraceae bacterium]